MRKNALKVVYDNACYVYMRMKNELPHIESPTGCHGYCSSEEWGFVVKPLYSIYSC